MNAASGTVVIVEMYTPGDQAERAARRAARAIAGTTPRVRHVRSIVVPDDETSFLIFAGGVDDVRRAAERVGIGGARVVAGVDAPPPFPPPKESS